MDLRQFCKLYRDITKQLRHTNSHEDQDWERVDFDGEVITVNCWNQLTFTRASFNRMS